MVIIQGILTVDSPAPWDDILIWLRELILFIGANRKVEVEASLGKEVDCKARRVIGANREESISNRVGLHQEIDQIQKTFEAVQRDFLQFLNSSASSEAMRGQFV
jgi:hypothetical protein